jgi:hypothetical protein
MRPVIYSILSAVVLFVVVGVIVDFWGGCVPPSRATSRQSGSPSIQTTKNDCGQTVAFVQDGHLFECIEQNKTKKIHSINGIADVRTGNGTTYLYYVVVFEDR